MSFQHFYDLVKYIGNCGSFAISLPLKSEFVEMNLIFLAVSASFFVIVRQKDWDGEGEGEERRRTIY